MEMTLTVHLPRRRPHPVDVVVRWSGRHTAADLCARLAECLGEPVDHLTSRGLRVSPDAVVGAPPLLHGAAVSVRSHAPGPAEEQVAAEGAGVLQVAVVGGPDAGRARALTPPAVLVGRAPASGLLVGDEALSRVHVAFRMSPSGVVVEDEGSTNGVTVDGRRATGPVPVDSSSVVVAGSTTLRLRSSPGRGLPTVGSGDGFVTMAEPRATVAVEGPVEVECPPPRPERHRARVPWVAALVPVPIGLGLAWFLGPQLLVFALLGPVMLLAGALGDRWGSGRAARRDAGAHEEAVRRARDRLGDCLTEERARLDRRHPDPHAVLATAEHLLPGLWTGDDLLSLRLGIGVVATRVAWVEDGCRTHPTAPATPMVLRLAEVGSLGVVGPSEVTDAVLRSVVGQLCATQPPSRVAVSVASTRAAWSWCARLPHHLPVADRGEDHPVRVLVVPEDEAGTPPVAAGRSAGWHLVVAARDRGSLPPGCGAVLTVGPGGGHLLESSTGPPVRLVADGVGAWWADRLSRALAPVRCTRTSAGSTSRAVPDEVGLDDVLPDGRPEADAVVAGWDAATARGGGLAQPVAGVGVGPDGVHAIDLARDGPHVLVGGTTGSGKSEFLRTLVASLAVSCPPRDLNLVLVDFKGGAAFGPCADLPHVVGLVTDLDDHLASRALTSLRAELRRRERLLAEAGAPDLEAYARSPSSRREPLPRLVVVVDELRTLVDEVPDLVSGLVRLAAQGRSLGIHLVLATQRPAGAVTAEVQANVSLRIAFRVRDRSDSVAVVEDGTAADISPHTPGRAVVRGADGRLRTFQSAIIGSASHEDPARSLQVFAADGDAPGRDHADPSPDADRTMGADATLGAARRARRTHELVRTIAAAHRLTGGSDPRRPWLPPLPSEVTRDALSHSVVGAGRAATLGLVDEPDLQRVGPLTWHPTAGTWLISGHPRSGRTSALRALVSGACAVHDPGSLHVHLVDPASELTDLAALPHAGTHVSGPDQRTLLALVDHLRAVVVARRAAGVSPSVWDSDGGQPTILVVADGWEQLAESQGEGSVTSVAEDLVRVLRDGAAVGVVGAVTGGRALLQPRWAGLGGSTVLLGRLDPLDVALAGLRPAEVPRDPPPGRGIRLEDRREVQFALVGPDRLAEALGAAAAGPGSAWRYRPLPERVVLPRRAPGAGSAQGARGEVSRVPSAGEGGVPSAGEGGAHPLGVFGEAHDAWCWRPEVHGRALLVSGPGRSGRTNALHVLMASLAGQGRTVVLVTRTGSAGTPAAGVVDHGARTPAWWSNVSVIDPTDVDALVAARRVDPRLAVLVDDADLIDRTPVAAALHEVVDLVDRDDGLVVAVSTSTTLATRFRGLDVAVARRRTGLLLQPGPGDLDLLGAPRVRGLPAVPGRGVFVSGGSATEVQVYLAPP